MARRILTNLNLEQNEIQNVVIHKLASAPSTPVEGQVYYNTTDKKYYLRQDAAWKDITGRLDDVLSGANAIQLTDNGNGTLTLDILTATQSDKGLMSSTDKTKLDSATSSNTASTLVIRDSSGDFAANNVSGNSFIIGETQNGSTPTTHAASIAYVNSVMTSGIKLKGNIDCSTNPNYPVGIVGDAYNVSVAGRIGGASGEEVDAGDLIICSVDNAGGTEASVGTSWFVIEKNTNYATETVSGYVRLATQAETNTGTNDTAVITPLKLKTWYDTQEASARYSEDIGLGDTTKVFIVTHDLNSSKIQAQVIDNSTKEVVDPDIEHTSLNSVTVRFNKAPALNAYKVIIHG
jgi:hypothetical protein